jgi:hypothetical protein
MKHIFYSVFFIVLLLGVNKTYAQQVTDSTIQAGHFEYTNVVSGITNSINVNYAFSPAPFSSSMNMVLNTPFPKFLTVDIVNIADSVLIHWAPSSTSNMYSNLFNISALSSGTYYVNVNDTTSSLLYAIPFTK